jgi:hypothetical protein
VPIFDVGSPAYQTYPIAQTASLVWSGTFAPLGSISPAVTLRDITIINQGTASVVLGSGSVTATTGLPLPAGAQLTIQGWTATSNNKNNDIYGICSNGTAVTTVAGLATLASVV